MRHPVAEQIEDYLMGRLTSPHEREWFERHARNCASCQRALREAERARWCLQWLVTAEPPPVPGPDFYARVQQSIERKKSSGWLDNLVSSFHPRLAYPLAFVALLLAAWTVTLPVGQVEEMTPLDVLSAQFASISFPDSDQNLNRDLVMGNLVESESE